MKNLAVRWTIGDVSSRGFDALALSIEGLTNLLPEAQFVVGVNSISVEEAKRRVGAIADRVDWFLANEDIQHVLRPYTGENRAEGVAWKFVPIRLFPNLYELSLDNDVVLWDLPSSLTGWLASGDTCLIAEDVRPAFGQFAHLCGAEPRNSGIRGLPPGFDLERQLLRVLDQHPAVMCSELDEQGLQVAAVTQGPHDVVRLEDVSICSPFPPHWRQLGRCGAHFVGLNTRSLPWTHDGLSGEEHIYRNWDGWLPVVRPRIQAAARSASLV